MRYGSMVTGGCLALLSLLHLDRGDVGAALLLAAVAAAALLWGVLGSGARERADASRPADPEVEVARARTWRRIAVLGLALSVVGALTFPPMGLVVGALTLYAASQLRRSSRLLAARPVA